MGMGDEGALQTQTTVQGATAERTYLMPEEVAKMPQKVSALRSYMRVRYPNMPAAETDLDLVKQYNELQSKTDMDIIKELADDEAAFRSLTQSWFEHSPLYEAIKRIAERGGRLAIVSDHGSIKVKEASKVVGDRSVNSNLRYKQGKNLQFEAKQVLDYPKPDQLYLPKPNVSTRYIFAKEDYFFVYPNNYNHFAQYYKNTFQHGGISLEEMLVPCAIYNSR